MQIKTGLLDYSQWEFVIIFKYEMLLINAFIDLRQQLFYINCSVN